MKVIYLDLEDATSMPKDLMQEIYIQTVFTMPVLRFKNKIGLNTLAPQLDGSFPPSSQRSSDPSSLHFSSLPNLRSQLDSEKKKLLTVSLQLPHISELAEC